MKEMVLRNSLTLCIDKPQSVKNKMTTCTIHINLKQKCFSFCSSFSDGLN